MGNLFDLIASIGSPPATEPATPPRRVDLIVHAAANDPQAAAEAPAAPRAQTHAPAAESAAEAASEPQRFIRTAATATPEWRAARDRYISHVMTCRACHAPTGRYCPTGAELRAIYDATPLEMTP